MQIARYWTYASERPPGSPGGRGLRRRGWSAVSLADAERHALERLTAATQARDAGAPRDRVDPERGYNGAGETVIFEEIVESHPHHVVTRNVYGARCLNTPEVLIADVDVPELPSARRGPGFSPTLAALTGVLAGTVIGNAVAGSSFSMAWPAVGGALAGGVGLALRLRPGALRGPAGNARAALDAFVRAHPDWSVRIYATPAGFRYIATHRTFDPRSPEVAEFFDATGTDARYARMCTQQGCFRARLTAKPWRIGMSVRFRPPAELWPAVAVEAAARQAWIDTYEPLAAHYAACHFVGVVGTGAMCEEAQSVVDAHDLHTQAGSSELGLA